MGGEQERHDLCLLSVATQADLSPTLKLPEMKGVTLVQFSWDK
jgi:hypothetical protein